MTPEQQPSRAPMGADDEGWIVVQRTCSPPFASSQVVSLLARGEATASGDVGAVIVAPRGRATFDTLLSAFPGAWWREITGREAVVCTVTVSAPAAVTIMRSTAEGAARVVAMERIAAGQTVSERLTLPDADGGWLWIEVAAEDEAVTVSQVVWSLSAPMPRRCSTTICITTFDRERDCVGVLDRLARAGELEMVDRIIVVDQGTRTLGDAEGFAEVAEVLGERLRVIRQPNLGGSGGFSRGMLAALEDDPEFVLLLDDDVRVDSEFIRRLVMAAGFAARPAIVGAQMLSLTEPTVLHSFGEQVDRRSWLWRPAVPELSDVDLATTPLATTPSLHRRVGVDFNGWWMCLVPTSVIRRQGAALPLFIKWDDTEFALRALQDDVATVTLPGAVVWHMPWTAKDDGLDWQAYFQLRNRLVTALLHGRGSGGVVLASLAQDLNHLLCQQYGSAAVRRLALQDVLRGPDHLVGSLTRRAADARGALARAGQILVPGPIEAGGRALPPRPRGRIATATRLARVLVHQFRRPRLGPAVDASMVRADGRWWSLGLLDSAAVSSATGGGSFVSRRDRRASVSLARDAVALRLRLVWQWHRLARRYRAARDDLAAPESWSRLFEARVSD